MLIDGEGSGLYNHAGRGTGSGYIYGYGDNDGNGWGKGDGYGNNEGTGSGDGFSIYGNAHFMVITVVLDEGDNLTAFAEYLNAKP